MSPPPGSPPLKPCQRTGTRPKAARCGMNGSSAAPSASSEGQRSFFPSSGCLDVASSPRSSRVPELCGDFPSTHRTDLDHDLSGPLAWLRSLAGPALLSLDASRSLPVWRPFSRSWWPLSLGPMPQEEPGQLVWQQVQSPGHFQEAVVSAPSLPRSLLLTLPFKTWG